MAFRPGVQDKPSVRKQTITIRGGGGGTTITDTRLRDPKSGAPSQSPDAVLVTTTQTGTQPKQVVAVQSPSAQIQIQDTQKLQTIRQVAERESREKGRLSARTTLNLLRAQANAEGQVPREAFLEIARLDPSALKVPQDDAITFTRFEKEKIFLKAKPKFTGTVRPATQKEIAAQKKFTGRLLNKLDQFNKVQRTKPGGLSNKQALEQGAILATLEGLAAGRAFGRTIKDTGLGGISLIKGIPGFVRDPRGVSKTQASNIKQGLLQLRSQGAFTGIARGEPGAFGEAVGTVAAAIAIQKFPVGKAVKAAKPSSVLKIAKIPKSVVGSLKTSRVASRIVKTKTFKKSLLVTNKAKQRFGVAVDTQGNFVIFVGRGASVKARTISAATAKAQLKTTKSVSKFTTADLKKLTSRIGVSQNKGGAPIIFLGRGSQQKAAKLTRAVKQAQDRAKLDIESAARVKARTLARAKAAEPRQLKLKRVKAEKLKLADEKRIIRNIRIQRIKRQRALQRQAVKRKVVRIAGRPVRRIKGIKTRLKKKRLLRAEAAEKKRIEAAIKKGREKKLLDLTGVRVKAVIKKPKKISRAEKRSLARIDKAVRQRLRGDVGLSDSELRAIRTTTKKVKRATQSLDKIREEERIRKAIQFRLKQNRLTQKEIRGIEIVEKQTKKVRKQLTEQERIQKAISQRLSGKQDLSTRDLKKIQSSLKKIETPTKVTKKGLTDLKEQERIRKAIAQRLGTKADLSARQKDSVRIFSKLTKSQRKALQKLDEQEKLRQALQKRFTRRIASQREQATISRTKQELITIKKKPGKSTVQKRFQRRIAAERAKINKQRRIIKQRSKDIRKEQKIIRRFKRRKAAAKPKKILRKRETPLRKRVKARARPRARVAQPPVLKTKRERFPAAIARFRAPPGRLRPPEAIIRPKGKVAVRTKKITKVKPVPKTKPRLKVKPKAKVRIIARTRVRTRVVTVVKTKAKVGLRARVKTKTFLRQKAETKQKQVKFPRVFRRTDKKKQRRFSANQGFNTFIKEKGQKKFFKANVKPQRIKRATNLGTDITDKSTAATFRIKAVAKKVKQKDARKFKNLFKFRKPKRGSKIKRPAAIEKNKFRIDSGGERSGITAKGLIAVRRAAQRRKLAKKLGTIRTSKKKFKRRKR